jgi:hypothetical protein
MTARVGQFFAKRWSLCGGPYTVAMMRVCIALVAFKTISRLSEFGVIGLGDDAPGNMYRPIGILLLWPGMPSPAVMSLVVTIGKVASVAMLFGVASRPAAALTALCMWIVTSYDAAFSLPWSHGFNLQMLVLLGFVGARCGDCLSIDALVRRFRRLPARTSFTDPAAYRWPVIFVTGIVTFTFFCAGCIKLWNGGLDFSWIFSDNLRNQIASRYESNGIPRSVVADWLVQSPWRYQTAALLNIGNQIVPFACLLVMHRPRWRVFLGLCVAAEITALGVVMELWNEYWYALLVVFVDFDRAIAFVRARFRRGSQNPLSEVQHQANLKTLGSSARWHQWYLAAFSLLFVVVAFGLDQRPRLYPFSSFPMYAKIRAAKPYNQHLPFDVLGSRIDVISTPPLPTEALEALNQDLNYKKLWRAEPGLLRDGLDGLFAHAVRSFPGHSISIVRVYRSAFRIPAYPALPNAITVNLRLVGERDAAGNFRFDQPVPDPSPQ